MVLAHRYGAPVTERRRAWRRFSSAPGARAGLCILAAFAVAAALADLADKRFVKVAIANPAHAPYGKAAQQAMEKGGGN